MNLLCARKRLYTATVAAFATLLLGFATTPGTHAAEGDTRGTIMVGTASQSIGSDNTFGTSFGFRWSLEIEEDLFWNIGATFTSTSGERKVAGQEFELTSNSTTLNTGLVYGFYLGADSIVYPFAGGGVSYTTYSVDFTYPGSDVGETSGASPGIFGLAGLEARLSESFDIILQYIVSASSITSEAGDTIPVFSAGFLLSFRISV